jgi:hypothetical protein
MRAGFIISGVLGAGTALVFTAAALVSMLFPNGTTVAASWNGGAVWAKGGMVVDGGVAMPVPAPAFVPAPETVTPDGGAVIEGPAQP